MKNGFRLFIGFMVVAPIALVTYVVSFFTGKPRAVEILGPKVTRIAKFMQQFFPPKISSASEFGLFKSKVKDKRKIWRMIYDYPIEYPDDNTVKLVVQNCPFAEAIVKLNISEFGSYMCQGDWEVAKDNADKWTFERNCTIGTGGKVCDFTYKQVK